MGKGTTLLRRAGSPSEFGPWENTRQVNMKRSDLQRRSDLERREKRTPEGVLLNIVLIKY